MSFRGASANLMLLRRLLVILSCIFFNTLSIADVSAQTCQSDNPLIVLQGKSLSALYGAAVKRLHVQSWDGHEFQSVAFQIDQKNQQNRYQLSDTSATIFDDNDELVLLLRQGGKRHAAYQNNNAILAEIKIPSSRQDITRWFYVLEDDIVFPASNNFLVTYLAESDTVQASSYQATFSSTRPFLINDFRWRNPATNTFSDDLVDTMKIRHQGRLFGFLDFRRSHQDYTSKLIAVKQGALRVIRRTENRVRIFWKLKSPALTIDYVMMPEEFSMDTLIDLPFRIGIFFKDLETFTTVDWNEKVVPLQLTGLEATERLNIDGEMTVAEKQLNQRLGNRFQLVGDYGEMGITLSIPVSLPIQSWVYYMDDSLLRDPPEEDPGQYGNMGFRTTGWERVGTGQNSVDFTICMSN